MVLAEGTYYPLVFRDMEVLVPGCIVRQRAGWCHAGNSENNHWMYKVMGVCKRRIMGSELMMPVSEEGMRLLSLRPPS